MAILELMKQRHSVRQYTEKKIEQDKRIALDLLAEEINKESDILISFLNFVISIHLKMVYTAYTIQG